MFSQNWVEFNPAMKIKLINRLIARVTIVKILMQALKHKSTTSYISESPEGGEGNKGKLSME